jgi:hypothetical protein
MPTAKTQRKPTTRKPATPKTTSSRSRTAAAKKPTRATADRATGLSEEVIKSLEAGQRTAIDAVRKFVDTLDEKLPAVGERPTKRQDVIDAAMEMADRLVHTQYDFIRSVVHSAGKALNGREDGKR